MKARKILTILSATSALLLVAGCSNSQQSSEKTAKQSGKKQSSEKSSSKKKVFKAKVVKKQSSESSSSEASSSSSSSQSSQSSSSASSQSSSSAASSSSSSQTQRYSDEEYAAAYWFSGNGVTFSEDSIFWHSPTISNLYLYQPSKTTGNVTHLTVNANDIYIEFDVNPAHPHGLSHETVTKDSLNFILSQRKDDIDDYISEQASSPDNPNNQ